MGRDLKELKVFKRRLNSGELIIDAIKGDDGDGRRSGALILTDQRLVFYFLVLIASDIERSYSLLDIKGIESTRKGGLLRIHAGGRLHAFRADQADVEPFKARIMEAVRIAGGACEGTDIKDLPLNAKMMFLLGGCVAYWPLKIAIDYFNLPRTWWALLALFFCLGLIVTDLWDKRATQRNVDLEKRTVSNFPFQN